MGLGSKEEGVDFRLEFQHLHDGVINSFPAEDHSFFLNAINVLRINLVAMSEAEAY